MSEKWLEERVPGYAALPGPDRDAIKAFALLWSLFESRLMGNDANARRIAQAVERWETDGVLCAELYDAEVAYFRERYFQNGELTFRFDNLQLRRQDMPDLVAACIRGDAGSARDRVLTTLIIVWRYRNNLFHGEKWAYDLQGQLANFSCANAVLMRVLERHAGFG
ncbi:hypothetical protein [Shinella sp.]|uniref:hypothetical protein n=2 Tax=Alphaproteobacteria TaxID=28211 RepID=UPI004037031C